jgi:hypothetical protein
MARVAIATVLGGIVLFAWGFVFWTQMPLPAEVIRPLPGEDQAIDAFKQNVRSSGVYVFPGYPQGGPDDSLPGGLPSSAAVEEWKAKHRKGPVGMVLYNSGREPMSPHMFILGLTLDLVISFVASVLLFSAGLSRYLPRAMFVFGLGVFAALTTHLKQANWMYFPWEYSQMLCIDVLVGSLLLAIVVAAVVKPAEAVYPPTA